jgi:integrase
MPNTITARIAVRAQARHCPRSVAELLYRFGQTPEMRHQAGETARQIRRLTKRIHEQFGTLSIPAIEQHDFRSRVYDWRDEMADTPAECERTIRLLSRCIAWGVDRGLVRENRIDGLRYRWHHGTRPRADIVWTPQMITRIRPHLGEIAPAFEFALWTALRQSDVVSLRQDALDDTGWLHVLPQKTAVSTGIWVHLPTYSLAPLNALVNRLHARDRDQLMPESWNQRTFRRLFEHAKVSAGLGDHDLHWHDLRGTTVTWLFEAGCTQAETAAVVGLAPAEGMVKRYAAQSRTYAEHAFEKLDTYMKENLGAFFAESTACAASR